MLYGPIMKRSNFGMIRTQRSARLKWLDLHNLLAVVTIVWGTVVGISDAIQKRNTAHRRAQLPGSGYGASAEEGA